MDWIKIINWEVLAGVLGTIVAAFVGYYQIKNAMPKPRSRLKNDLEILQLIGKDHERFNEVKEQVDELIVEIYQKVPKLKINDLKGYVTFIIYMIIQGCGFSIWTFIIISKNGWNWWALLTIYFALGSFLTLLQLPKMIRNKKARLHRDKSRNTTINQSVNQIE